MLNAVPEPVAPDVPVTVTVWLCVVLEFIPPEVKLWLCSIFEANVPSAVVVEDVNPPFVPWKYGVGVGLPPPEKYTVAW